MKNVYWEVTGEQAVEIQHGVPSCWARTLTIRYLKTQQEG